MKKMLDRAINRENLKFVANLLIDVEYTVFFGTALGIHRDGDVLLKDDDVDILANSNDYNIIKTILTSNGYIHHIDTNGIFSQFRKTIDGEHTLLDCYFFEEYDEDNVIEKWNFSGDYAQSSNHIIIPNELILTKNIEYFGVKLKVPSNLEAVCTWLYGERYKETLVKDIDYTHQIINNKPVIGYKK
jgi:hypothetical protein